MGRVQNEVTGRRERGSGLRPRPRVAAGRAARLALLRPCLYKRMFVPWAVTGDDGFEYAWQAPDPEPDEGPGLTWRETGANYWSGSSGSSASRHRHARDIGSLGRVPAPRGPARPLADHHRRPLRHGRGGAGRDRRSMGSPVAHLGKRVERGALPHISRAAQCTSAAFGG